MPLFFPRPRLFTNQHQLGFKLLPAFNHETATGIFFGLNLDGTETVHWKSKLLGCPQEVILCDEYVVTLDSFFLAENRHAIVAYNLNGEVTIDLELADFLSTQEIQMNHNDQSQLCNDLDESSPGISYWMENAEINLVKDPTYELRLNFKWGKLIGVNLLNGKVSQYWPPKISGKYGIYSEKRICASAKG